MRSNAIDVLVVDSGGGADCRRPKPDGEMGGKNPLPDLQARLMSAAGATQAQTGTVSKSRTCLIFINQIREKIGVIFSNPRDHYRRKSAEMPLLGTYRYSAHRSH